MNVFKYIFKQMNESFLSRKLSKINNNYNAIKQSVCGKMINDLYRESGYEYIPGLYGDKNRGTILPIKKEIDITVENEIDIDSFSNYMLITNNLYLNKMHEISFNYTNPDTYFGLSWTNFEIDDNYDDFLFNRKSDLLSINKEYKLSMGNSIYYNGSSKKVYICINDEGFVYFGDDRESCSFLFKLSDLIEKTLYFYIGINKNKTKITANIESFNYTLKNYDIFKSVRTVFSSNNPTVNHAITSKDLDDGKQFEITMKVFNITTNCKLIAKIGDLNELLITDNGVTLGGLLKSNNKILNNTFVILVKDDNSIFLNSNRIGKLEGSFKYFTFDFYGIGSFEYDFNYLENIPTVNTSSILLDDLGNQEYNFNMSGDIYTENVYKVILVGLADWDYSNIKIKQIESTLEAFYWGFTNDPSFINKFKSNNNYYNTGEPYFNSSTGKIYLDGVVSNDFEHVDKTACNVYIENSKETRIGDYRYNYNVGNPLYFYLILLNGFFKFSFDYSSFSNGIGYFPEINDNSFKSIETGIKNFNFNNNDIYNSYHQYLGKSDLTVRVKIKSLNGFIHSFIIVQKNALLPPLFSIEDYLLDLQSETTIFSIDYNGESWQNRIKSENMINVNDMINFDDEIIVTVSRIKGIIEINKYNNGIGDLIKKINLTSFYDEEIICSCLVKEYNLSYNTELTIVPASRFVLDNVTFLQSSSTTPYYFLYESSTKSYNQSVSFNNYKLDGVVCWGFSSDPENIDLSNFTIREKIDEIKKLRGVHWNAFDKEIRYNNYLVKSNYDTFNKVEDSVTFSVGFDSQLNLNGEEFIYIEKAFYGFYIMFYSNFNILFKDMIL